MSAAEKLNFVLMFLRNVDAYPLMELSDPIQAAELRGAHRIRRRIIELLESENPVDFVFSQLEENRAITP
jgi:hypothetical protein